MTEKIICAGFGGQGIMVLGKILAYCAMLENKHTTWMPSYGAEQRGGTAHSMVVFSNEFVASPVVAEPDTAILMNQPSVDKFLPKVKKDGLVILNSSLAKINSRRSDITLIKIPLTELASGIGNVKTANMVALGAYLAKKKLLSKKAAVAATKFIFGEDKKELIDLNTKAIEEGMKWKSK